MLDVDTGTPDLHPPRAQATDLPATVSRMSEPQIPDRVRRPAARLVRRSAEAPVTREWPDDVRVLFGDAPPSSVGGRGRSSAVPARARRPCWSISRCIASPPVPIRSRC